MPRMNPQTMNWSLRLSRWKHMVETSLSAAPLQIGRDCDRQKLRLHWAQDPDEEPACARRAPRFCGRDGSVFLMPIVSSSAAAIISSRSEVKLRASGSSSSLLLSLLSSGSVGFVSPPEGGWCCEGGFEEPPVGDLGFISMIVLFVKQVHLQNVGAAVDVHAGSAQWLRPRGSLSWSMMRPEGGLTYSLRPPGRRRRLSEG